MACCCPHPDRFRCSEWRGGDGSEPCECSCHVPEYLWGDDEDDRFPAYCAACGRESDCLMNDLCGRCYECQGGVKLRGQ